MNWEPMLSWRDHPQGGPGLPIAAILLALTLAGAAWRLAAFAFNVWPHGDVVLDAAVAEAIAYRGALIVPMVDVRYYPTDRFGWGYPPDQHPPLWSLLGAPLALLLGDGYAALKLLSLVVGVALVPVAYLACRPLIGRGPALLTAVLVAGSYPLVDFSGNGSLWVLLALFYLLFVWRTGAWEPADQGNAVLIGIVMGLAALTNYPAVTLPATLVLVHVLRRGPAALRRDALVGPAVSLGVMLAVVAPWLVHNAVQFGNPFWSQPLERSLAGGSRLVEYTIVGEEVLKRPVPSPEGAAAAWRARAVDLYGNVGFVARQLLVLAPVLVGFFLAGLLVLGLGSLGPARRRPERGEGSSGMVRRSFADAQDDTGASLELARATPGDLRPLVVLALVHLALVLWWPTTKFRYLVPLLPLVFAIGSWFLWQLKPPSARGALVVVTAGLCLFTNLWTFTSIPSHTYYYDGGLVRDNFGGQGETEWVEETRRLRAAADAIVARGLGPVLGDHILHTFTTYPLVVNSTAYPPEVVAHLVRKHGIRYVVAERARAEGYRFLAPTELWSDDRLVVLELRPGG